MQVPKNQSYSSYYSLSSNQLLDSLSKRLDSITKTGFSFSDKLVNVLNKLDKEMIEKITIISYALQDLSNRLDTEVIDALIETDWGYMEEVPWHLYYDVFEVNEKTNIQLEKQEKIDELMINFFNKARLEENSNFTKQSKSWRRLSHQLGDGWETLVNSLYNNIQRKDIVSAIPLLFIVMERLMVNIKSEHLEEKNSTQIRKNVCEEIENEREGLEKIRRYYSSVEVFKKLVENKVFAKAQYNEPYDGILRRNLAMHGKSTPEKWTEKDMYRLLTIAMSFAATGEALKTIKSNKI